MFGIGDKSTGEGGTEKRAEGTRDLVQKNRGRHDRSQEKYIKLTRRDPRTELYIRKSHVISFYPVVNPPPMYNYSRVGVGEMWYEVEESPYEILELLRGKS